MVSYPPDGRGWINQIQNLVLRKSTFGKQYPFLPRFRGWFLGWAGTRAPLRSILPTPVNVAVFFRRLAGRRGVGFFLLVGVLAIPSSASSQTILLPSTVRIGLQPLMRLPGCCCRLTMNEYLSIFGEIFSCFCLTELWYSFAETSWTSSSSVSLVSVFNISSFIIVLCFFGGAERSSSSKSSTSKSVSDSDIIARSVGPPLNHHTPL